MSAHLRHFRSQWTTKDRGRHQVRQQKKLRAPFYAVRTKGRLQCRASLQVTPNSTQRCIRRNFRLRKIREKTLSLRTSPRARSQKPHHRQKSRRRTLLLTPSSPALPPNLYLESKILLQRWTL